MKLNNFSYLKDYRNLKVLVTGSTGFKGTWLIFWLNKLGAKVVGIGLKPESDSVLFKELKIQNKSKQYINNIENFDKTHQIIKKEKPDIIFHLAAQSIVSESYKDPLGTIRTNTLGSANILESVRLNKIKNLVFITSDKCYLNRELKRSYNELDVLGGYDNYSSSKAAAEVIFHSYYNCYFKNKNLFTATARAGNVIGGGDFKKNRIISDLFKSIQLNKKLTLRNPKSTRPWQHVLEPLSGYLKLGSYLMNRKLSNNIYPSWNFGPNLKNCKEVIEIVGMFYRELNMKKNIKFLKLKKFKEANLLSLSIVKAEKELKWKPNLELKECIMLTSEWYIDYFKEKDLTKTTNKQIDFFTNK